MALSHFLFSQWHSEDYDSLLNIDWLLKSKADWIVSVLFIKFLLAFWEFENSEQFQDIIFSISQKIQCSGF